MKKQNVPDCQKIIPSDTNSEHLQLGEEDLPQGTKMSIFFKRKIQTKFQFYERFFYSRGV